MNTLQQKIESLLFYKNEPVSFSWLAKQLGCKTSKIKSELEDMFVFYENRGLTLVFADESVSLLTAEVSNDIINKLSKDDKEQPLSKQALETLSIVLYKNKISKSEIDYIRGVNSIFILRNLLMRGLIKKQINPDDKRSYLYLITHDTLSFLGINNVKELSQFDYFSEKLRKLENEWRSEQNQEDDLVN